VPEMTRFKGCILGHAVGDALGAPVEFIARDIILADHGPEGVTDMRPWHTEGSAFRKGSWTDDTQMMIATAQGILDADEKDLAVSPSTIPKVLDPIDTVASRYLEWVATQDDPSNQRYPGTTCLSALRSGVIGSTFEPINDRKGAGGIMRVAPAGLAYPPERAFDNAAEFAAITHGHPTGYLSAGFYADVIARLTTGAALPEAIAETREYLLGFDDSQQTRNAVDLAVELHMAEDDIEPGIERIGQGWVAEEALGIALFCALNSPEEFALGTLSAVNITGDSDTTGALTGALLGTMLGESSIPGSWLMVLEGRDILSDLATRLHDLWGPIG
jgi:ADP-ribosylglycohydrolase